MQFTDTVHCTYKIQELRMCIKHTVFSIQYTTCILLLAAWILDKNQPYMKYSGGKIPICRDLISGVQISGYLKYIT